MTEHQRTTYACAALTVIAIWPGLKIARKMVKFVSFLIALLALAFLPIRVV